jgi:hypothetical protein
MPVPAAMIEVEVRVDHPSNPVGVDASLSESLGDVSALRAVMLLRLPVGFRHPGVEQEGPSFMEHGIPKDRLDPREARSGFARRPYEEAVVDASDPVLSHSGAPPGLQSDDTVDPKRR